MLITHQHARAIDQEQALINQAHHQAINYPDDSGDYDWEFGMTKEQEIDDAWSQHLDPWGYAGDTLRCGCCACCGCTCNDEWEDWWWYSLTEEERQEQRAVTDVDLAWELAINNGLNN